MTLTAARDADPDEIAAWASDLSDKYLQCRSLGHPWRPWTADWIAKERLYESVERCSRCLTRRVQLLTELGEIHGTQYLYPEGYQHKGHGRITGRGRGMLRVERVTRQMDQRRRKAAA